MILSMTGFGRSEGVFEGKKITIDLKSLNSKSFDLNTKVPSRYREKEFDIRKILTDRIGRGKVDCYINMENLELNTDVKINKELVKSYVEELRGVADDAPDFEYLKMAIRFPDALSTRSEALEENEWFFLVGLLENAIVKFDEFRNTEGKTLKRELTKNLNSIEENLQKVIPFEETRITAVRERYQNILKEFENVDETRFYQELAYYTEKLDISEEKVRLTQHLKYYEEVMNKEHFNGKKLGFIIQEIGREINTLGSKANHAEIQKLVVMMKDDLEKMKEQTLNVL
ncbi:YicC/YloC family endoribonuclease [Chryseobacterium lacus]|uniref:YicC/YloC family endoribonuclease n=1 Tax=Chryseobacterium lacus TaxID=2058346 RepID=UPI00086F166B|nr:YicC/YloC family endoribonuclease [Chryseobacterium lacus]ODS88051.1 MAG: YicC family protein [Chryseobacterium sp. SCN 40-13]RST26909.1 YicC family protein [Chryseobacterium lacus]